MRGLIALDIDGTVTSGLGKIPEEVIAFLQQLYSEKWTIAFVTGRCFSWTKDTLSPLGFPYYLAVQNGACLLSMPEGAIIEEKVVAADLFAKMDTICESLQTDYALFAGYRKQDRIYYRPKGHKTQELTYLQKRAQNLHESWIAVSDYCGLELESAASLKVIADQETAGLVAKQVEASLDLYCPLIHDPYGSGYYVAQATHKEANKGQAVMGLRSHLQLSGPVIVAGDDRNDIPMLQVADKRIVMQTAPSEMHALADIVANPAIESGIIQALQRAIQ